MMKKVLFQLHWFLGISAGLILAIMGVTGAIFSYEKQIIRLISPSSFEVYSQNSAVLNPTQLYQKINNQFPAKKIKTLTVTSSSTEAASVTFDDGSKHGETRTVNPYTAQLLPQTNGEAFFKFVENIHRFLALGEFAKLWSDGSDNQPEQWREYGKQLTGISALALIYFTLSGIYLRWPRKSSLKEWFMVKKNLTGRSFLWNLHAVVGTWVLIFFLLLTLTGLTWSYGWYRQAAYAVMGVEDPKAKNKNAPTEPKAKSDTSAGSKNGEKNDKKSVLSAAILLPILDQSWQVFNNKVASYSSASFKIPTGGNSIEISFVDAIPQHERARNTLKYNFEQQQVEELSFYKDKPLNEKIMTSMLPVHRGSFFGPIWQFFTMIAALSMPLFFITGWMLYLKRRKQKKSTKAAQQTLPLNQKAPFDHDQAAWLIIYASQTGFAEQIAWRTAQSLHLANIPAQVFAIHQLKIEQLKTAEKALFIVSTYGQGEPPDHARPFAKKQFKQAIDLSQLDYAVLALGDREYQDTYCNFGKQLEQWLTESKANALFDLITLNNAEPEDINRWNAALSSVTHSKLKSMSVEKVFDQWQISKRTLLNPNSMGESAFEVQLKANHDAAWQAGDVAEIQCGNSDKDILDFIAAHQLNADATIQYKNVSTTLFKALRYLNLRDHLKMSDGQSLSNNIKGSDAQQWVDILKQLPVREYSIASITQDGYLSLVIRQQRHGQELGLGSGWLTVHAPLDQAILVRIRTNENFHAPDDNRPIILIGNGTGIAGLMSILKDRQQHGFDNNWLIFGERQQQIDFFFAEEIQQWLSQKHLQRLDLAFSRDQPERVYVQQRLLEQREQVQQWVAQGASIYVCGSIEGMAPAVDQALTDILGEPVMEQLVTEERYMRDVY